MSRIFAYALIAFFLTACVSSRVKDDSPASDLDALQAAIKRNATRTVLPNGKEYCVEDARTDEEHDNCALDLEDAVFVGNGKLDRIVTLTEQAVRRIKLRLQPCGFFRSLFNPGECKQ